MKFGSSKRQTTVDLSGYRPLPVVYQLRWSILQKVKKGEDPLPDIQGRDEAKKDVLRALLSGAHAYLVSEEGTGKTRLARSLTKLLPTVPVIKGCPYNDDPLWPKELLCARCRASSDPAGEYGVDFVPGARRFSRIQGNEYTNEAKLLGLKDIHAIAQGRSPADPQVFSGTGILRANRGILFIDELPAIRTKVQVLLHPVLEEKKAILEEYKWEHFLDLVLIATGNPVGFSHVNEVPRPLLDRLELVYMDLPDEDTERQIMLKEKFSVEPDSFERTDETDYPSYPEFEDVKRQVAAPWWVVDWVNAAVRQSRTCPWLEKRASIRATTRAIDHTYASVELENRHVATLKDVSQALKLALRSRIGLRVDLIDFESPKNTLEKGDELAEYLLCRALADSDVQWHASKEKLVADIESLLSEGTENLTARLGGYPELSRVIMQMKEMGRERVSDDLNGIERDLAMAPDKLDPAVLEEYNYSALEAVCNLAWHRSMIGDAVRQKLYVPQMGSFPQRKQ